MGPLVVERFKQDWGRERGGTGGAGGESAGTVDENVLKNPVTLKMRLQQFSDKVGL